MNSRLLVLDTCSQLCSVAIGDGSVEYSQSSTQSRRHADEVLSMISALLVESGWQLSAIDAIGFVCGPGSFTGLRIGTAVTQGLAFGVNIPAVPISSLAMLGRRAQRLRSMPVTVACLMHAREDEFYFGVFRDAGDGVPEILEADSIVSAKQLFEVIPHWQSRHPGLVLAGEAWGHELMADMASAFDSSSVVTGSPDAGELLELAIAAYRAGHTVPADQATPVYLKEELVYRTVAEQ